MHFSCHPALLFALGLMLVPGFAAEKKKSKPTEAADAPPQIISKDGGKMPWTDAPMVLVPVTVGKPKWTTLEQLKQFAAKGDPLACYELGNRYLEGNEVPVDAAKAAPLLELAARGNVANAWFKLGKIYHDGLTGEPDYGRALEYFTNAARLGVTEAQHNLGAMLVSARGVRRDYIEGLAWIIVAKQSGAASDAETQVRTRLGKRPADITAAENRAKEISADLAHAEVRAVRPGAPPAPRAEPKLSSPLSDIPATKPVVTAPKIEPTKVTVTVPAPDLPK